MKTTPTCRTLLLLALALLLGVPTSVRAQFRLPRFLSPSSNGESSGNPSSNSTPLSLTNGMQLILVSNVEDAARLATNVFNQVEETETLKQEVDGLLRDAATNLYVAAGIQAGLFEGLQQYLGHLKEVQKVEMTNDEMWGQMMIRYSKAVADRSDVSNLVPILTVDLPGAQVNAEAVKALIKDGAAQIEAMETNQLSCYEVVARTIASLELVEKHYTNAVSFTASAREALRKKLDSLQAKVVATELLTAGVAGGLAAYEAKHAKQFNPLKLKTYLREAKLLVALLQQVNARRDQLKGMKQYASAAASLLTQIYQQGPVLLQNNLAIRDVLIALRKTAEDCILQRTANRAEAEKAIKDIGGRAEEAEAKEEIIIFS